MSFSLNSYPVSFRAKYGASDWTFEYLEKPHNGSPKEEASLSADEQNKIACSRNVYDDMPLVSYTTQYGMSVFEGIKALPQKDGSLAIFRPQRNAERFFKSMGGLYMPQFPQKLFVEACVETIRRNQKLGWTPTYKAEWEKDSYMSADAVYIRPFTYSEGGVGVGLSSHPWVIIVCTTVGAYFDNKLSGAVISNKFRATKNGTGWIKASSNYVISALAKHDAAVAGFMECIFLDAQEHKYIEEGSSCNIFFYLKNGELVTPELGDTILPGITRESLIELARSQNVKVTERKITVDEALSEAKECFVSGTAAGVTPIDALTYNGKKVVFNGGKVGELTAQLRNTLKGIQYGSIPDTNAWLVKV
ncbi:MAG: branched-chain amino acid aminotransferase [Termitinemataceae bacterium]|nr:MAG: branched-chain amino acid aminotransferase [Termitinemataceae bacterium]